MKMSVIYFVFVFMCCFTFLVLCLKSTTFNKHLSVSLFLSGERMLYRRKIRVPIQSPVRFLLQKEVKSGRLYFFSL